MNNKKINFCLLVLSIMIIKISSLQSMQYTNDKYQAAATAVELTSREWQGYYDVFDTLHKIVIEEKADFIYERRGFGYQVFGDAHDSSFNRREYQNQDLINDLQHCLMYASVAKFSRNLTNIFHDNGNLGGGRNMTSPLNFLDGLKILSCYKKQPLHDEIGRIQNDISKIFPHRSYKRSFICGGLSTVLGFGAFVVAFNKSCDWNKAVITCGLGALGVSAICFAKSLGQYRLQKRFPNLKLAADIVAQWSKS